MAPLLFSNSDLSQMQYNSSYQNQAKKDSTKRLSSVHISKASINNSATPSHHPTCWARPPERDKLFFACYVIYTCINIALISYRTDLSTLHDSKVKEIQLFYISHQYIPIQAFFLSYSLPKFLTAVFSCSIPRTLAITDVVVILPHSILNQVQVQE